MKLSLSFRLPALAGCCAVLATASFTEAAPIVPGTGTKLEAVGDDFEDPEWTWYPNDPKSSADLDNQSRMPAGRSANGRWRENTDRGQPDVVRPVPTPEGGLSGSEWSLLLASKATGIPGRPSGKGEQDDIYMSVHPRIGRYIPVSQGPSVVVRVYMPPFEEWEDRTGSSFGFRATVRGAKPGERKTEPYWPGIFINHKRPSQVRPGQPAATFAVRAGTRGNDYTVMEIDETGWWTLGMSFSPDGQIHYYIRKGVEDLTPEDRVASHYAYNFRTQSFIDVFFDVFGANNGRTWTTPWIIDDPAVYLAYPPRMQAQQRAPQHSSR